MSKTSKGFIYLARRPCGKVSAMYWDEPGHEREIAKSVANWIRRGDKVERVEVFEGDPMPEQVCLPVCKECKKKEGLTA
ncbi:MAG: hypothetical protein HY849_00380 [Nitrosomonadales bacterium]|nr:hypothetical protein [Nitrosomonadales bacterium]